MISLPKPTGLPELTRLVGPVAVIEAARTRTVGPVAFAHAKIIHVTEGSTHVLTETGVWTMRPGDALVLSAGSSASTRPDPFVRTWTIYLDEDFLRQHMMWAIPPEAILLQGVHPADWNGDPIALRPRIERLHRLEPVLRQMSVNNDTSRPDAVARQMALFAQTVELVVPGIYFSECDTVRGRDSEDDCPCPPQHRPGNRLVAR